MPCLASFAQERSTWHIIERASQWILTLTRWKSDETSCGCEYHWAVQGAEKVLGSKLNLNLLNL